LQKGVLVLGHDRFDHEYYMTGRDEGQVRAFVGGLGLSFFEMRLADATDTELSFVTKQRTRDALERMCQTLRSLAERVPVARAAIGPPQSLAAYVDTWRDVAQKTGATFEPARMALELTRGEDRAAVVTEWNSDGEAYRTTAALTVRDPIDEDYHFLSVERALRDDEAKKYGADARQLLGRLVADTPHVRVEAHALVAHLEPELEDPSNAMTVLKRLEALYALLRAAAGPYR
jgi:hypothetical protein